MSLFFDGPAQVGPVSFAGLGSEGSVFFALNAYVVTAGQSGLPTTSGQVSPGGAFSPITGTAQIPDGASVVVTVSIRTKSAPPQKLAKGTFSLPIPG